MIKTIDRIRGEGDGNGLVIAGSAKVAIRESVASGNNFSGLYVEHAGTELNVEGCLIANNKGNGIRSQPSTIVRVSNSTITGNATGLSDAGALLTRGNNTVDGNTTNVSGPITSLPGI